MKALNIQKMGSTRQSGFTIIELVVVILLLGILTATALPRFIDVTDQAHDAVVDAIEGGLATGQALFHAQWVAEGSNGTSVTGFSATASATNGYPLMTTSAQCVSAYTGTLQGGYPTIFEATQVASSPAIAAVVNAALNTQVGNGIDVMALSLSDDGSCAYVYIGDQIADGDATGAQVITMTNTANTSRTTL